MRNIWRDLRRGILKGQIRLEILWREADLLTIRPFVGGNPSGGRKSLRKIRPNRAHEQPRDPIAEKKNPAGAFDLDATRRGPTSPQSK